MPRSDSYSCVESIACLSETPQNKSINNYDIATLVSSVNIDDNDEDSAVYLQPQVSTNRNNSQETVKNEILITEDFYIIYFRCFHGMKCIIIMKILILQGIKIRNILLSFLYLIFLQVFFLSLIHQASFLFNLNRKKQM